MIITKKKEMDEIAASLERKRTVYLFGCGSCAEQCATGGEKEVKEMARALTEAGFEVAGSSVVDETCYRQLVLKELRTKKELKEAGSVLVLACGAGVKTVAEALGEGVPVLPALDSMFLASVERVGRFFEGCSLCSECVLGSTAAVCPHTECPKGLLNGPCGGVAGSMCEVDTENECAWVRIYRRLKVQDRLHVMRKVHAPKDHSATQRPRRVLLRHPARPAGESRG